MAKELGKIQKPSLDGFREERKLYCVLLLPYLKGINVPKDYSEKVSLYWQQVSEQVESLEKAGKVSHVFHESVFRSGEEAMNMIKRMNEKSYGLVKAKCKAGATLQALEDKNLLDEYLDWSLCISVVGRSQNVLEQVAGFQAEAAIKREEHISKKINETLRENEAGMLIMTDENRIRIQPKISSDIQVFLVRPPALNEVQHWLREYMLERMKRKRVDQEAGEESSVHEDE
jgi:hypothetical protein